MSCNYTSHAKEALTGMKAAKEKALEIIGGKAETYAKKRCPVDTGNLRNSITHARLDENTEVIGTNVEYAAPVELGHHSRSGKHIAGKPFLRPAVEDHRSEYRDIIKTVMKNA